MIIAASEKVPLEKCPALVLNADFRPLTYYPLSLWCWQDAVKSVFLEKVSIENISENNQNNLGSNNLKDKWELILSKVELPSTRMLLSQQAELESFDSEEITIALSPNWENMIKSRKVIIENTVKKIFGDQIIINFSTKQLTKNNPANTSGKNQNEKNNLQTKKIEPKTNLSTNMSIKETYDDSSKNLANFFNGEIIDLDE